MSVRISATLIVKNESGVLRDCLRSLKPVADEIIIVDTGSSDDTVAIAAAEGCGVIGFQWIDDFAAARNHALDQATGDWILYIDADERLRPCDAAALRSDLADPALIAATVRFTPRTGYTPYPEHRLFRRTPAIRFEGAIHETILPSLGRATANGARRVGDARLAIDHIGYDGDQSHKLDRNLRLLEKQLHAAPKRGYLWWHLGHVRRDLGDIAAARAAWEHGAGLARDNTPAEPTGALCDIELAKLRLDRGEDARPLIARALASYPDNWMLRWLHAKALAQAGEYDAAQAVFAALAAVDPDTLIAPMSYDRRIFGRGAELEMGHCAFRAGRHEDSAQYYRKAMAHGAG